MSSADDIEIKGTAAEGETQIVFYTPPYREYSMQLEPGTTVLNVQIDGQPIEEFDRVDIERSEHRITFRVYELGRKCPPHPMGFRETGEGFPCSPSTEGIASHYDEGFALTFSEGPLSIVDVRLD